MLVSLGSGMRERCPVCPLCRGWMYCPPVTEASRPPSPGSSLLPLPFTCSRQRTAQALLPKGISGALNSWGMEQELRTKGCPGTSSLSFPSLRKHIKSKNAARLWIISLFEGFSSPNFERVIQERNVGEEVLINGGGKAVTKLRGWVHLQDAERKPNHQGIAASQDQNHADTKCGWVLLKSHGWEMKEWVTRV